MRILHTADWHLGRKLNRVHRIEEQEAVLDQLVEQVHALDPHAVVVAGDVFDVFTPTAEAERLYYRTVRRLAQGGERAVLVVAGNHDSGARLSAPRGVLEALGVFVAGDPHDPTDVPRKTSFPGFEVEDAGPGWLTLSYPDHDPVRFHLLPFPSRSRLPRHLQPDERPMDELARALWEELPPFQGPTFLVSHLYARSGHDAREDRDDFVGGAYALGPEAFDPYEAAFLGHLHTPHGGQRWRYAGSPLRFDFDDPRRDRGAWLWDDGTWTFVPVACQRELHVLEVTDVDEALERADGLEACWVRLQFEAGTVLTPSDRERVKEAYGPCLVDIQFDVPVDRGARGHLADLGRIDPEEAFREFYEAQTEAEAPPELVDLFLELLQQEAPT